MNLQIDHIPPVRVRMAFVWHHVGWFRGMVQIAFVALVAASVSLSPKVPKVIMLCHLLHAQPQNARSRLRVTNCVDPLESAKSAVPAVQAA